MGATIYQRKSDNRWCVAIDMPKDENGRRKRKTIYGDTKKEVEEKRNKILFEMQTGEYIEQSKDSFIFFLKEFHKIGAGYDMWNPKSIMPIKAKWEQTTASLYKMYIDVHFEPYFGKQRLIDIKTLTLDKYYNYKMSASREYEIAIKDKIVKKIAPPISNNTAKKLNCFIKAALTYAVKNGMIKKNPADNVLLSKKDKYRPTIYTEKQFSILVSGIIGTDDEIPVLLAGACGMRRGEMFGLYWRNVDFKNRTITIKQTDVRFDKYIEKKPKNDNSARTFKAPEYVIDIMDEYIKKNGGYKKNCEKKVITKWLPDAYTKHFSNLLEELGLPHIRLHDLRHYNAVLLMSHGVPDKVAAKRLGHDVATLRGTYQHVLEDMDTSAADEIDVMLTGETKEERRKKFNIVKKRAEG